MYIVTFLAIQKFGRLRPENFLHVTHVYLGHVAEIQ